MQDDFEFLEYSGDDKTFESGATREEKPVSKGRYDLLSPIYNHRLAIIMAKGSINHGDRNWEQGMPLGQYMDSALRHLNQHLSGKRDEDHLAQAAFNVMAMIHTSELIERGLLPRSLDDLPNYERKKDETNQ